MNPKQEAFVREYLVDLCQAKAAVRAGYSPRSARTTARDLMARDDVQAAVVAARAARAERVELSADQVLQDLWAIAKADPRELVEYRRTCCRYCWGKGFRYQRTAGEMERDREAHAALLLKARPAKRAIIGDFDEKGGPGYHAKRDPHPDCEECFGDGIGRTHVHDTRRLSPAAARLYAGMKETKDGFEVKTLDQDGALVNVGRHLGVFKDHVEISGKVQAQVSYRANMPKRDE